MIPTFLAPGLLAGAAAVAIPLGLHFLYKPRFRRQPWAAMTFLRKSLEQTSQRVKFREWILLAIRCLLIALLALALARPTGSVMVGGRGEGVDAILVFDTTLSMGANDGAVDRLTRAKTAADAIIDNLPPNSTVQLITVSDRATAAGPRTPSNRAEAKRAVEAISLTALSGDMLPGLTEALAALERGAAPNKEVYLFTDLQKSGWANQAAAIRAAARTLADRATLLVVRTGDADRRLTNVALTALTTPGGVPHTRSRLPVTVVIRNTGSTPARNLTVTLAVDGNVADKEATTIEELAPGQAVPVTLTARLETAGIRVLTARVRADDLPGDDQLDRVISVRDTLRVLLVDGSPDPRDPKQSGSHFIRNAITPVPTDRMNDYHVQLTTVTAAEATAGLLGLHEVCILCDAPLGSSANIAGLSEAFTGRLEGFVQNGGVLLIGGGEHVQAAAYNAILGESGARLLPLPLGPPWTPPDSDPLKFAPDTAAGFLARFREEPYRTATADAEITQALGLADVVSAAEVLLRFTTGAPAVAWKPVGRGGVLVVACPFDATGGTWPAKAGSFLTFTQLFLARVAETPADGFNRSTGSTLKWDVPTGTGPVELVPPTGPREELPPAAGQPPSVSTAVFGAGLYRFTAAGQDPPTGPTFAITPDLRDSEDLTALTDSELIDILGFKPVLLAADGSGATDYTTERSRREWTIWVLLAVLAVAVGESLWAWRCGRAV